MVAEWRSSLELIRKFRSTHEAPVDKMGCHKLARPDAAPKDRRFQTLVSLLLSSQTKDEITAAAINRLHTLPLTIEGVLRTDETKLAELICPVGFYRRKAANLVRISKILQTRYDGDIPPTLSELTELPGIGPKMGILCMQNAWNINIGVGVDVHVHRISNRLGWVKTSSPEKTREALENLLPEEIWPEINPLFVGFGQILCLPIRPKCHDCPLNKICPSSTVKFIEDL